MQQTPDANRIHIGIFGSRNAGKSSLLNALCGQDVAVVSPVPGTTTDPVRKQMEFYPIGPVLFMDTAGWDDTGELGKLRVDKTSEVLEYTDIAIIVLSPFEATPEKKISELRARNIPYILTVNGKCKNLPNGALQIDAKTGEGLDELREAIVNAVPKDLEPETLASHLIEPYDTVLLVAPQDIQAPKGRLILPQQQVLRDLLDNHAIPTIVCSDELEKALDSLKYKPSLVITDSQVFARVNDILPKNVRLTSFSILMARDKGDLDLYIKGAKAIAGITDGDTILIAEACSHNPLDGDIGREKIPALLKRFTGVDLNIDIASGKDFPKELSKYKLVIHCGGCMFNRRHVLSRIMRCKAQGVPVTNYGIAIAYMNGILERVCY